MTIATFTSTGTKATTAAKLDKAIFGVEVKNYELLKQAYVAYLANGRLNLAVTKNRGDVRGGGKKPWRQKGTGRARFGSTRNPIWRGGGVAFGPTGDENYTHKLPVSVKRLAIRQALSVAANDHKVSVIESFTKLDGKTKNMVAFLQKLGVDGKVLCVVDTKDATKVRATQNVQNLKVCSAKYLNVFDILNADAVVISKSALEVITEWLASTK